MSLMLYFPLILIKNKPQTIKIQVVPPWANYFALENI